MSSSESKATARPIAAQLRPGSSQDIWITNGNGVIATVNMRVSGYSQQIMDSVNQRDALLAALERIVAVVDATTRCGFLPSTFPELTAARAALALARGEKGTT